MTDSAPERYAIRQESDGCWTVYDTAAPQTREARYLVGAQKDKAVELARRLNAAVPLQPSQRES